MKWVSIYLILPALLLLVSIGSVAAATKVPYLEAVQVYQKERPTPGDVQRQIVLLNAQARLTADWPEPYRVLMDVYSGIGRYDQAKVACQKYLSHQSQNADAELALISIDLRQHQTAEARRQYLEAVLRDRQMNLLPEVVADVYCQLAQIAWQNFENDRARKYIEFALKRFGQDLKAYQVLRMIVDADNKTGPIQEMQEQVREFQARIMGNPMDGLSAIQLAILAGKAGLKDTLSTWAGYAGGIKRTFGPTQEWPVNLQLELAESYLGVDQPARTMDILRALLPQVQKEHPTTRPGKTASTFNETRVRLLMILAGRKMGDPKTVAEQQNWVDNLTEVILRQPADLPGRLGLVSTFYSVYGDPAVPGTIRRALDLAQAAVKFIPDDPKAKTALALALARGGEFEQARKIFRELNEPTNPLVLLGQVLCAMNRNDGAAARALLKKALATSPYIPLRDVLLKAAVQMKLDDPPAPDLSAVVQAFRQFSSKHLDFPGQYRNACQLALEAKGDPARGQNTEILITLTNTTDMPLIVGSAGIIPPTCFVEIQPRTADGPATQSPKLYLYMPILGRQILAPKKSLSSSAFLDEAASADAKIRWNDFVANRAAKITRVAIQARIYTTAALTESVEFTLAQSLPATVELPRVNDGLAALVENKMDEPALAEPWETAKLAQWVLTAAALKDRQPAVAAGLTRHLQGSTDPETRTALAWALRFADKPTPDAFNTLAGLLKSKYWFTRLMVLDTLGQLQGKAGAKLFQFYAVEDPDDLVRQMATGYLLY